MDAFKRSGRFSLAMSHFVDPPTMKTPNSISRFEAMLSCPAKLGVDCSWTFIKIPKEVSDKLSRRGRTSIEGTINGHSFQATLEPDGQLGHWLKVSEELKKVARAQNGDIVKLKITPVENEPEPVIPSAFRDALAGAPEARKVWDETTTLARLDWIHWIESAKQPKTRTKRIDAACDMLAKGKSRVCCFDSSGYYSKAFCVPETAD